MQNITTHLTLAMIDKQYNQWTYIWYCGELHYRIKSIMIEIKELDITYPIALRTCTLPDMAVQRVHGWYDFDTNHVFRRTKWIMFSLMLILVAISLWCTNLLSCLLFLTIAGGCLL